MKKFETPLSFVSVFIISVQSEAEETTQKKIPAALASLTCERMCELKLFVCKGENACVRARECVRVCERMRVYVRER